MAIYRITRLTSTYMQRAIAMAMSSDTTAHGGCRGLSTTNKTAGATSQPRGCAIRRELARVARGF